MILLGKYNFENLRNCLQGIFSFDMTDNTVTIILWQLRIIIKKQESVELFIVSYEKNSNQQRYISFGKFDLNK